MLHVVIITPAFAINEKDSVSLPFLQLFCLELIKQKISLSVISEQFPDGGNYIWNGIEVFTLRRKTPRIFYKFLRKSRLNKCLREIHSKNRIHVIHNFWFNILGIISEQFAISNKIKHLITLTGQDVLPGNEQLTNIKDYQGQLICPSSFHKKKLQENYALDPLIIGWGIEKVSPISTDRPIDLIQCGWINSVKNNILFLEIVKELHQSGFVKNALICGGGPMFSQLLEDINRLGLKEVVEVKDSIPRIEVLQWMQKSKILVHTSHFESFGLVLAEALACNCLVMSTPVGIAYDDEEIFKCKTKEEFITQIKTSLNSYTLPNTINHTNYPITDTIQDYMSLYQSV